METFWHDLRYAIRTLSKSPGFTAIAILTLALGIGSNTAIFSILDALMLKMLPVSNPKQLVVLNVFSRGEREDGFSYAEFEQLRDRSQSFDGMFAFDTTSFSVTVDGQPGIIRGQSVSGTFCSVLGLRPVLGRTLTVDDDRPAKPPVAVISYDYWSRRFFRDPSVLGKTVAIKRIPFTIVGVLPPAFHGIQLGESHDIWTPMVYWDRLRLNDHLTLSVMARLKQGKTEQEANAELTVTDRQVSIETAGSKLSPEVERAILTRAIKLRPAGKGLPDFPNQFFQVLPILMVAVGLVLLIASANVANLLLARASGRQTEIAVRMALGAGRFRLVRQLFTESFLLALGGGTGGVLLAFAASGYLSRMLSGGPDPFPLATEPDFRALLFTLAVSVLTAVVFGLAPALRATHIDVYPALKENSGRGTNTVSRQRFRNFLVVAQISSSTVLLIGSGLLLRSLIGLIHVNTGFRQENISLISTYPTLVGYSGDKEFNLYAALQERIRAIPGVQSASISRFSLLSGGRWIRDLSIPGHAIGADEKPRANCNAVAPQFFETMGIPVLLGREFTASDGSSAPKVAVISESFARKYFATGNPLGQQFGFREILDGQERTQVVQVVGVTRDVRSLRLREQDDVSAVYIPLAQAPADILGQVTLEIRSVGDPVAATTAVRAAVRSIDRTLPLVDVRTQTEQIEESVVSERSLTTISSWFGVLAMLLACVGLSGLVAFSVAQRTREIGIRMALGAQPASVLGLVINQGFRSVLLGLGIGVAAALALTRLLSGFLYGVAATDPATFAGVAVGLALAALLTIYIPARRATRVDPIAALRYE